MTVFAVLSNAPNPGLGERVSGTYANGGNLYQFSPTIWFVVDEDVTTAQICEKLGIGTGGFSGAMVLRFGSYFGHASTALWEWLKLKGAAP